MLTSAIEKVVNLISPYECLVCNYEGRVVCQQCWQSNVPLRKPACFWCNTISQDGRTCSKCKRKTHLDGAIIPYRLNGLVEQCIYELKYYHNREMAKFLADSIYNNLDDMKFDYISYVPATGKNQRRRGYNQSKLLAKEISRIQDIPLHNSLSRVSHTDQIGLNRPDRLASVKGNFIPNKRYDNKNVIIVDDVLTTGATVNECAKTLKQAGAKKVWTVVVAKK